jgi:hypothetical protein
MGDRTYCSLYVYGTVTQAQLEAFADRHAFDSHENRMEFDEVNRGEMSSEIFEELQTLGLSWAWHWEAGDEYGAGVKFYDHETGNTEEFNTCDENIVLTLDELKDPANVEKAIRWQTWDDAQRCDIIETAEVAA